MKNNISKKIVILIILIIQTNLIVTINAQISEKGIPISFKAPVMELNKVPIITMPTFDLKMLLQEDSIMNTGLYKSTRFAKPFNVNIDLKAEGLKDVIEGEGVIYRLGIKSTGAYSLNIIFSDFKLPPLAKLYIYNFNKQSVLGAFTYANNKEFKSFATSPVEGDLVFIELFEPFETEFESHTIIGQVSHDYKNIFKSFGYGQSGSCQININCPQGEPWQTQKRSVCKYIINGTDHNSGVLVNNTQFDGTPYFLTAAHCFNMFSGWDNKNAAANNSIFYFNYESPTCTSENVTPQSIEGAYLKAYWETSDFFLVQLSSQPPQNYNAYYAGWDKRNVNANSEAGIHHPHGDIKKISLSSNPVLSTDLFSNTFNSSGHSWRIVWTSGVTESGSSGSPLFNQNKKIVGQLAGGYSDCVTHEEYGHEYGPNQPDWYGKFSSSWTGGGTNTTRLSNWLDPCGAGVDTLEGTYWHYVSGNPYIYGQNPLCTSEDYWINNQPIGTKIYWSCTSNIHKVSSENPDTCEFEKYSNGNGYIYALIDKVCPGDINLSKPIHTGPYSSSDYPITGPSSAPCNSWVAFSIPYLDGVTSINWIWPYDWTYENGQGTRFLALTTGQYSGIVGVGVNNICGISGSYHTEYVYVYGYCGYGFIFYPNPASDNITLTINEKAYSITNYSTIEELDERNIKPNDQTKFIINIYNNLGTLMSTTTRIGLSFNIPLINMRDGTYLIEVSDGKNSYRESLIIKHE